MEQTKTCSHCKKEQLVVEFYLIKSGARIGRYESWCKACKKIAGVHSDRKRRLLRPNRWQAASWKRILKTTFSAEEYDRIYSSQKGCCSICGMHQSKLKKRLGVDHNHETGQIRGLLCSKCNFLIGYMETNEHLLGHAKTYLAGWANKYLSA